MLRVGEEIRGSIYQEFSEEDYRDFARACCRTSAHIYDENPDALFVPVRGSCPLYRYSSLALHSFHPFYEQPLAFFIPATGDFKRSIALDTMVDIGIKFGNEGTRDYVLRLENSLDERRKLMKEVLRNKIGNPFFTEQKLDKNEKMLEKVRKWISYKPSQHLETKLDKLMVLDEICGGGSIASLVKSMRTIFPYSEITGLGIADDYGSKMKDSLKDLNIIATPTKRLIPMDKMNFLGSDYIYYYGDGGIKERTPNVFPVEEWNEYKQNDSRIIRYLEEEIRRQKDDAEILEVACVIPSSL